MTAPMFMTAPTHIVLTTDFSPSAMAAVPITGRLARIFKAKVTLLHIFQCVPKHRYPIPAEWMVEIIRRDVRSKLVEAKRILYEAGLETEVVVLEDGIPAEQILSFVKSCAAPLLVMAEAERCSADLAALGVKRASAFTAHAVQGTAFQIIAPSPCPVLTTSS